MLIDVVFAVLAKLRKEKNPFICKEKIKDPYCMRMVVERTRSATIKVKDAHNIVGAERKTCQDEVVGGQEELRCGCVANETAPVPKNQSG